ncbi:MAG TPA: L-histidine N(alpha)-methyltransferase [Candidatus Acidoferrales bacterium]|nr:L-histidine N(alpha)-methyltransferase [Candidatus Acidoferrales bacterium]
MKEEYSPPVVTASQRASWEAVAPSIWRLNGSLTSERVTPSLLRTLFDQPRWLSAYLLYDDKGSQLFERICELPEYYLTRTEEGILRCAAADIIAAAPVECIVELGAGSAKKTVHLLREQMRQRARGIFAPVDVSLPAMAASRDALGRELPGLSFCGLQARFEDGIAAICESLPTLFLFLGSTVGNLTRFEYMRFFELVGGAMGAGDFFLLGVDCVKETELLERAYDDSAGVTADFILNVFAHINRLAGSNFDRAAMRYWSCYNERAQQVEMYAFARRAHEVRFPGGPTLFWQESDPILVEISRKFDPIRLEQQLQFFGLKPLGRFSDPRGWFSLLLFKKA